MTDKKMRSCILGELQDKVFRILLSNIAHYVKEIVFIQFK